MEFRTSTFNAALRANEHHILSDPAPRALACALHRKREQRARPLAVYHTPRLLTIILLRPCPPSCQPLPRRVLLRTHNRTRRLATTCRRPSAPLYRGRATCGRRELAASRLEPVRAEGNIFLLRLARVPWLGSHLLLAEQLRVLVPHEHVVRERGRRDARHRGGSSGRGFVPTAVSRIYFPRSSRIIRKSSGI